MSYYAGANYQVPTYTFVFFYMKYYSISFFLIFLGLFGYSQSLRNPNFQSTCDESSTGICHWDLSWGKKDAISRENQGLSIEGTGGVVFLEQTVWVEVGEESKILTLSANIQTLELEGKGAGLNLAMYDQSGNLLSNKDLGGYQGFNRVRGNTDWRSYQIRAICPKNTHHVKVGAILYGKGKALFGNLNLEIQSIKKQVPSNLALTYISAAMDTIALHALMRDSVDLSAIKARALHIAGPAKTEAACHISIEYMLEALGDHHSFLMTPEAVKAWSGSTVQEKSSFVYPVGKLVSDCALIKVPFFHGGDSENILAYADSLQQLLQKYDAQNLKGWIIDLRENTGGNMEPMIAGLGPLFSGKELGHLVDIHGQKETWSYENGSYYWEEEKMMQVSKPIQLQETRPIAVLQSGQTGSSGEIVLISFLGNAKTRTFGQASWGLTTGNGAFDLSDGARMMLASTQMADRNGKIYKGKVQPDEFIAPGHEKEEGPVLKRAIQWIMEYE